ncbi:histidine kinase [Methylocystis sp. MJC1]|jgi:two-component system sensor histidine kinase UhpB|uniref:histidine kinase n=1 Tax=Methylocystis sp. MJC1 TaxID=2654282 RepID=UPI0013EA5425|nr:histidine kinase [Methylocystis sp. MJC1]KAF2989954.1 Signal transduction histidine-protein kinase/phosphatase UhpB [Methylocystis sp. MJC1]MBU6528838.1 ATP-binding protein [Methylocystis sp. MJC1]UZX11722.1 histidine kinase [Methylocystis sp. MJC1]
MISLKVGLSWLIGFVLLATLLINLTIQSMHAGPRIRAEAGSNLRLVREFVLTSIASLPDDENPTLVLRRLYANLGALRHVDIKILERGEAPPTQWSMADHASDDDPPTWFVKLVGVPSPRVILVPIRVNARDYGSVAIVSNPLDELEEIWSDMTWLASISLVVTLAIVILLLLLIRFSLTPFGALQAGLADLEAGKSGIRIAPRGASEFRNISNALNSLATTLDRMRQENRDLVNEIIEIGDSERKEIARDLHDEAGPCLFSIRAAAASLQEVVAQSPPDPVRLRQLSAIMDRASEALQSLFRGLLGRLRPKGLSELGLEAALKNLFASWSAGHPEVELRLSSPYDLSSLDETTAFTAYRVVQESVTNVFRHANANWAQVTLEFGWDRFGDRGESETEDAPTLIVIVEDDGIGLAAEHRSGMGLLGMRERVQGLGGRMKVERRAAGGTRVFVSLPIRDEEEPDRE